MLQSTIGLYLERDDDVYIQLSLVNQDENPYWLWTAVEHFSPSILGQVLGNHSAETFKRLWEMVSQWQCYFYVTDGWKVYAQFIPNGDQIVSKTYMTRVAGENTRLRHYESSVKAKDTWLFPIPCNA